MEKRFFVMRPHPHPARDNAIQAIRAAEDGEIVTIQEPKRTLEQNAMLWALLGEVSEQVEWHGTRLTPENWKDVFTASLRRAKVVPGLDGGFVVLGQSTSGMTKREFGELIELIQAFGAERNVKFSDVTWAQ